MKLPFSRNGLLTSFTEASIMPATLSTANTDNYWQNFLIFRKLMVF